MNKACLETMLVVAITANLIMFNVIQSETRKPETIAMQTELSSGETAQIASATSRLLYHSKMIAVESLIITKYSINLMFDTVIKAL